MEVDEITRIDPNVDYTQFSQSCESRLMEFEYKIRKMEASLLILESQLSSISCLENASVTQQESKSNEPEALETHLDLPQIVSEVDEVSVTAQDIPMGLKASEDQRFQKFFKMVHVGVPLPAVKLKMKAEGFDSSILDKPNEVIPDLSPQ